MYIEIWQGRHYICSISAVGAWEAIETAARWLAPQYSWRVKDPRNEY